MSRARGRPSVSEVEGMYVLDDEGDELVGWGAVWVRLDEAGEFRKQDGGLLDTARMSSGRWRVISQEDDWFVELSTDRRWQNFNPSVIEIEPPAIEKMQIEGDCLRGMWGFGVPGTYKKRETP